MWHKASCPPKGESGGINFVGVSISRILVRLTGRDLLRRSKNEQGKYLLRNLSPACHVSSHFRRCINLALHLDEIHQRLIHEQHWYLLALGVQPFLVESYLETFNETDLPLYERHGFRIAGGGKVARVGLDFWAMIRAPRTGS